MTDQKLLHVAASVKVMFWLHHLKCRIMALCHTLVMNCCQKCAFKCNKTNDSEDA